ncbi:MAG: hypothetical protein ACYCVD_17440 [Desulfitobacteriaceae bacterium]
MSREREVWLSEGEVENLLRGTIFWTDVVSRLDAPTRTPTVRRLGEPLPKRTWDNLDTELQVSVEGETEMGRAVQGRKKVVLLLVGVAFLTFGSWFYFVFRG